VAFYIDLHKIKEDDLVARYRFCTSEKVIGIIEIRKIDGNVSEIEAAPEDRLGRIFERSAWALMNHWQKGEYPDQTYWAS
jgi:hypothetical protein